MEKKISEEEIEGDGGLILIQTVYVDGDKKRVHTEPKAGQESLIAELEAKTKHPSEDYAKLETDKERIEFIAELLNLTGDEDGN